MKAKKKTTKASSKKSDKRPITFRFTAENEKRLRSLASSSGGTMQSVIIQLVSAASPRALKKAAK